MLTVDSQDSLTESASLMDCRDKKDPKLFNPRPRSKKMSDADFSHYSAQKIKEILGNSKHFKEVPSSGFKCSNHQNADARFFSLKGDKFGKLCAKCALLSEAINFKDCEQFLSENERRNKNIINNFYKNFLKSHKELEEVPGRDAFDEELKQTIDCLLGRLVGLKEELAEVLESCFERMHDKIQIMGVEKTYQFEQHKKHLAERRNKIRNFICEIEKNYPTFLFSADGSLVDPKIGQYSRQLAILGKNQSANVLECKPNLRKMAVRKEVVGEFEVALMKLMNKAVVTSNEPGPLDWTSGKSLSKGPNQNSQQLVPAIEKRQPSQIFPELEEVVFFEVQESQSISLYDVRPKNSITSEDWRNRVLTEERSSHGPPKNRSASLSEATLNSILKLTNERNMRNGRSSTNDAQQHDESNSRPDNQAQLQHSNSANLDSNHKPLLDEVSPIERQFSKNEFVSNVDEESKEKPAKNFFKKPNKVDVFGEKGEQQLRQLHHDEHHGFVEEQPSKPLPLPTLAPSVKKAISSPINLYLGGKSKSEFHDAKTSSKKKHFFQIKQTKLKSIVSQCDSSRWNDRP